MRKKIPIYQQDSLLISIRKEIITYFISDDREDFSHGISHTDRVLRLVNLLHREEGGNILVLSLAALLHDIARPMEERGECKSHAAKGADLVEEILKRYDISDETIAEIAYCVRNHNLRKKDVTLEAKILRDADKLDSLGAIAISRVMASTFQSKQYQRPIFDPEIADSGDEATSAIHYLTLIVKRYEKGDYFFTETAKQMALKRVEIMRNFITSFKKEWFLSDIESDIKKTNNSL